MEIKRNAHIAGFGLRISAETLAYRLKKPLADGRTCLHLAPMELLPRLAALIPPPR